MNRLGRRDAFLLLVLGVLPVLAYAPAWWEGRLIGTGDAAALHFPMKAAVWDSYRRGEMPSWNPAIFMGVPLLAAYRPAALYPPQVVLYFLEPFTAFQVLVLSSLSAAGMLLFVYMRRLGAGEGGAYLSGLSFALGPYLVGHLGDSAAIVAAPTLPLVLLAAEAHLERTTSLRTAGLAAALALLLLAGSPEAARAGLGLLAGRLLVGHFYPRHEERPAAGATLLAIVLGGMLAAPQLLPTLLAAREAGSSVTGLADRAAVLPGLTGLVLRYVSHTPAPALALAALPLALTDAPVRALGLALAVCLGLQWGRGPLAASGALAMIFDLTLSILAGLSLSAQWRARREPLGRRLRAYFLFASLAGAAALSVAAAALGPLPQSLAGSVGTLALAMILYFSLATAKSPVKARVWLLPLTVSFLLQPHGRRVWEEAPTREELYQATPTREAIDGAIGRGRSERIITLTRMWPRVEVWDLAYADLGGLLGRRSANGYDPMAPLRNRAAFDGMGVGGTLPAAFFRTDPTRLELLDVRWVQVPVSALAVPPDPAGLGDGVDLRLEPGRPRFIPLPIASATEVRLASSLSNAVLVPDEYPVARVFARLASGRDLELVLRAGRDTAEWAYDRPDVRPHVAHRRPRILESWRGSEVFEGHTYLATLKLPGRYYLDGLRIEGVPGAGNLTVSRLALFDAVTGRVTAVSGAAGYVSDTAHFREITTTPAVRLFELPASVGRAHVVERLRVLADEAAVRQALGAPTRIGLDPRREALAAAGEIAGVTLPAGATAGRAEVARAAGARLEVSAWGPGLLVVSEGWDPGWSATIDGRSAPPLRVNHVQMGVLLDAGVHRIEMRHRAAGLAPGTVLAGVGVLGLLLPLFRRGPAWRRPAEAAV